MKMLLFFFCFIPACCLAQKDTVVKYFNKNLEITTKDKADFLGVAVKKENSWLVFAVYPDTSTLLKAYYKDKRLRLKEGPYTVYYPQSKPAQQGYYQNNKMVGTWRFWYENGVLKDSGALDNNRLTGLWKSWHPNGRQKSSITFKTELSATDANYQKLLTYQDPFTFDGIRHGAFSTWYENGILESQGSFTNNYMEGEWLWFHENGAPSTVETYRQGKLTSLKCFDSTGLETGEFCSISKAAVLKHYGDYKNYIRENLTWPAEALKYKIQGKVTVRFTINKHGKVEYFQTQSDHPVLAKAVEDLFATMIDWYPAVSHNRVIDWQEEYIIPFYLNGNQN